MAIILGNMREQKTYSGLPKAEEDEEEWNIRNFPVAFEIVLN